MQRIEEIRLLADTLYKEGIAAKSEEDALTFYSKAINTLESVQKSDFSSDDWRSLSKCQFSAGVVCKDHKNSLLWHKKAIKSLNKIKHEHTLLDKRRIADYQVCMGIECKKEKYKILWFKKAIATRVKDGNNITPDDCRMLAKLHDSIGRWYKNPSNKLIRYNKAIAMLNKIKNNWRPSDKYQLADYLDDLGRVYIVNKQWLYAQQSFYDALNLLINRVDKNDDDYKLIVYLYEDLNCLVCDNLLDNQLYSFACDIFTNKELIAQELPEFANSLLRLNLTISTSAQSKMKYINYIFLLQLMQLVEASVDAPFFPNKNVHAYLTDSVNREWFRNLLKEVGKEVEKQISLETLCTITPNVMLDIVIRVKSHETTMNDLHNVVKQDADKLNSLYNELLVMKETIRNLEIELTTLKEEKNKQLKLSTKKASSIYKSPLTTFSIKTNKHKSVALGKEHRHLKCNA